ncbi:hypothetical protein CMV_020925 [Castanea mollissima]|uniref:Reverse transcriptase zinc-binding domain-containing protein n=1 Tax=Castanea mollissima TaxID=60419 RepID=A0A8J4QGN6_9ROSI|nr:hypothetical protein CMV_020925 [Castanea mollissima]
MKPKNQAQPQPPYQSQNQWRKKPSIVVFKARELRFTADRGGGGYCQRNEAVSLDLRQEQRRGERDKTSMDTGSMVVTFGQWKVFHGVLFRISWQQRLIYFPKGIITSLTSEQCNEVPETSLHALWSCPHAKKSWQSWLHICGKRFEEPEIQQPH